MSRPRPPALDVAPKITDWLRFDESGRPTLLTGRVELGQGAVTALVQIAAAELGVEPSGMAVISGDTDRTPNEGFTVGSLSVAQGGAAVAWAASAARSVLLSEAARRLNAGVEELSTAGGRVLVRGEDSGLALAALAVECDLDVEIAEHGGPGGMPRAATEFDRIDLPARVLGAPFIQDAWGRDMRVGRVLHPPRRDARLEAFEPADLEGRPGILKVLREGDAIGIVGVDSASVDAAIAAAAEAVRWSADTVRLPDLRDHMAARLDDGQVVVGAGTAPSDRGDRQIEVTASRGYVLHASIGPASATALWRDGHLTVESPTQGVYPLRDALAAAFDIAADAVTVRHAPGAGCYGHNGADDAAADAAWLARALPGTPVRVVWSRADEFRAAPLGAAMTTRVRLRMDGARIAAAEVAVASAPHSSRPGTAGHPWLLTPMRAKGPLRLPDLPDLPAQRGGGADRNAPPGYAIPEIRVTKALVRDLPFRTSALRGLGAHLNVFAVEMAIDAAAREAGEDPVAFRLAHLDDPRARAVIESVAHGGLPPPTEDRAWGLGYARYKNAAAYGAVAVELEMGERLRVRRARVALDTGRIINRDGVLNQTEGGFLQSVSWTLLEEVPLSGAAVAAETWEDYPILRFSDLPDDVEIDLIDRPDDPPLGCAEAMQGPTAAAIGTAARALLGEAVTDLPLTPERIAAALA